MKQPKFKGYSHDTESWHYGFGWFISDIPGVASLVTEEGIISCNLKSMGQFVGLDVDDKEIYTNDIVQPHNNEESYSVVMMGDGCIFGRHHFVSQFEGKPYEDKYDKALNLHSQRYVGTVYRLGVPYHQRVKTGSKNEVEFRK